MFLIVLYSFKTQYLQPLKRYIKFLIITMFFTVNAAKADDLNKIVKDKAIQKVQTYFNQLKTINAAFIQIDSEGNERKGKFLLSRPDKMRIDYLTPEKELILLDEDFLIHYNHSLDEVSYVSNENLPITLLSKKDLDFSKDVRVVKTNELKEGTQIEVVIPQKKKDEYTIVMFFTKQPFQLSRVTVVDKAGGEVELKLIDAYYNSSIPNSAFEFKNPRFFR